MRLSLVVPTYNRARRLSGALRSFVRQDLDRSLFEIIVVDNNSTDNTEQVIREHFGDSPGAWSYLFEPRQGLHYARNLGILSARGEIVVFGDDDIVADPHWLSSLLEEFDSDSTVGVVGGRVFPIWEKEPPAWIYDYGDEKFHRVFAYLDFGNERLLLKWQHAIGCNMAIRRDLAIRAGGSLPDTFPDSLRHLSGTGETGLIDKVRRLGFKVVYAPNAIVRHHAKAKRMTLKYFASRHRRTAIEEAYDDFRTYGRVGARRIAARAWRGIVDAVRTAPSKQNTGYFLAVQIAMNIEAFRQIIRVLTSRDLYQYIQLDSYLDQEMNWPQ